MRYVDVILPLPLDGLLTYAVDDSMAEKITLGVRVAVPLGKSKTYTAMAVRVHDNKPEFDVKDVAAVIDDVPMLLEQQYRLWLWISEYYMSSLGDILKAAFPAGLKDEDGYRPKTEKYIRLAENLRNRQAIDIALGILKNSKARKQAEVFGKYLAMSGWDKAADNGVADIEDVTEEELRNECHTTSAILRSLTSRKFLEAYSKEVGRLNHAGMPHPENIVKLNQVQQDAYNQILFGFLRKNVVLLHGVTSSGKTEIYIHLIEKTISEGKQVLYLLPEIALTVQIAKRLQRVFGNRLGIYHSKYSDAERVEIWKKQLSATPYDVILGARSAVFLPFQKLGLVIIDEEHETSFKQQDPAPRYHARSAAIMLASMYDGAKVLLGTATPSAESYYNAQTGKYGLVELTHRYKDIELPRIDIVDIKDLRHRKMMEGPFSPQLFTAIRTALQGGRQVILFQNRRGFAPMIECKVCGWVPKCDNCDVSLTLHKSMNQLTCHYCGYTYAIPKACPNCGNTDLRSRGFGTEKIEDIVRQTFPEARVARMDLDTTRTRNAYDRIISDFSAGRTNVLIGTQMVSKGLDFDNVSVVGILDADSMLNYPDFRAYEHAYMMIAQVSGRAGRKGSRGLVILQTRSPKLPVIRQVVNNDFAGFFRDLMDERRMFHYPPFYHLVYVFLRHRNESTADSAALELAGRLRGIFGERVLGPDKPSVARVNNVFIRKIVIKLETGCDYRRAKQLMRSAQKEMQKDKRFSTLTVHYDVDPM